MHHKLQKLVQKLAVENNIRVEVKDIYKQDGHSNRLILDSLYDLQQICFLLG